MRPVCKKSLTVTQIFEAKDALTDDDERDFYNKEYPAVHRAWSAYLGEDNGKHASSV